MQLQTFYKIETSKGEYSCGDIGISAEEWLNLLKHPDAQSYIDTLLCFLREPNHAATCSKVASKYGNSYNYYNAKVTNFSKWVQKYLNRFQILNTDGSETYWCIPMQKGWDTNQGFKWQLRDELVDALRKYLMRNLINQYSNLEEPFNGFEEEYKWELLDNTEGKNVLDIIKNLRGKNIVDNARVDGVFKSLWESQSNELTAIGEHLLDETRAIDERIANYKIEMRALCPKDWNNCANDERTAAAILTCKYPEKYTVYKDEIYQLICRYFGFESRKAGKKFSHFIKIINKFTDEFGEEIQELMLPSINRFRNKPLNLAIQTLFWCMRDRMNTDVKETNELFNEYTMPQKKYQKYIELLQETHNLVLTGAPGTGKTYMAQKIAEEMGAVTKFVQFHPSYDYTDFVEGLRPIEKEDGQMGFERRDGVFKEFCKLAISTKTTQMPKTVSQIPDTTNKVGTDFRDIYKSIVDDIQSGRLTTYFTPQKTQSLSVKDGRIVYRADSNSPRCEKESNIKLLFDHFVRCNKYNLNDLDRDDYWKLISQLTNGRTKTIDYIEYNWVLQELLNRYKQRNDNQNLRIVAHPDVISPEALMLNHENEENLNPFVLIIDEINRGEASKIFGELFYAIDPGYRGKKDHLVQTQYQNLVPETDVFAKGFYVPENVYILATMNDIDRSVESMDFAMRRRFTWQEITPDDTESMLDTLPCVTKAKDTMHRLNNAIAETDGLGAAYMIGPSYFLKLGENGGNFEKLWKMNIEPLLKEYLRGFRKSKEILETFSKAYFDNNDFVTEQPELIDED